MNFRQIETFNWIAQLGSFSAAAERLNATQSAVSARIQELEQSLGVRLFDRSGRTVKLTLKGRALLPYAEKILGLAASIRSEIGARGSHSGIIRIGVVEIIAFSWFPELLNRLAESFPAIVFEVIADLTVNLKRMVDSGQLDVAFAALPHPSPTIISKPLGRVRMQWIAHASLGLGNSVAAPEKLSDALFLSPSRESDLHWDIIKCLSSQNLTPRGVYTCNSMAVMTHLTRCGFGVAILPELLLREQIQTGECEVVRIGCPVEHYDFYVMFKSAVVDPALHTICELADAVTTFDRVGEDTPLALQERSQGRRGG